SNRLVQCRIDTRLGTVLASMGRHAESLVALERARAIVQTLVDDRPSDKTCSILLAKVHGNRAISLIKAGKVAEGRDHHLKAHTLFLAAARAESSDLECQNYLAMSYGNVGCAYMSARRDKEALEFLEAGQVIYQRPLKANPAVTGFQEQSAYYSNVAA